MQRYLIRRLLLLIPTLLLASVLIFAIIALAPGDPARMMLGPQATPEEVAVERDRLGLEPADPGPLRHLAHRCRQLNLGVSQSNRRSVTSLIADALPYTLRLALISLAVAMLIGFPLGMLAAINANRRIDAIITGDQLARAGDAGLLVRLAPDPLLQRAAEVAAGLWHRRAESAALSSACHLPDHAGRDDRRLEPVRVLALRPLGHDRRAERRLRPHRPRKGPGRECRHLPHALRNAMIPVITIVGIQFGRLLGGAVVTESVFAYPGIGRLVINSIANRDYPVVQATLMLVVLIFLITNIIVDASYASSIRA